MQVSGVDTGEVDLRGSNKEQFLSVYLADIHNNPPPSGTTVKLETDNGLFSGPTEWVVGGSNGAIGSPLNAISPYFFSFKMIQEESPNDKIQGDVVMTIKTPGGNEITGTTTTFYMTVKDDPAPDPAP